MDLSPQAIEAARLKLRQRYAEAGQRVGGKGTARRKAKKIHKTPVVDDKKLALAIKRIGASMIQGIEEVQMTRGDGKVLSFMNPKVQAAPSANTYVVTGEPMVKDTEKDLEAIIRNLKQNCDKLPKTKENVELLKQLEELEKRRGQVGSAAQLNEFTKEVGKKKDQDQDHDDNHHGGYDHDDDHDDQQEEDQDHDDHDVPDHDDQDDVPDLVDNFEDVSKE